MPPAAARLTTHSAGPYTSCSPARVQWRGAVRRAPRPDLLTLRALPTDCRALSHRRAPGAPFPASPLARPPSRHDPLAGYPAGYARRGRPPCHSGPRAPRSLRHQRRLSLLAHAPGDSARRRVPHRAAGLRVAAQALRRRCCHQARRRPHQAAPARRVPQPRLSILLRSSSPFPGCSRRRDRTDGNRRRYEPRALARLPVRRREPPARAATAWPPARRSAHR